MSLDFRLQYAMVGSCSCTIKTNDPTYHRRYCTYRVLNEVVDARQAAAELAVKADAEIARLQSILSKIDMVVDKMAGLRGYTDGIDEIRSLLGDRNGGLCYSARSSIELR